MMAHIIVCLLLVLGLFGSALGQDPIRKVDFANFTYPAFCAGEDAENIAVKDREFSYEKQEDGYIDRMHFRVNEPEFGDLTGDRSDEALIISVCNTGGTGNFSEGYIFTMSGGKPVLLARIPGGDRAYGGLRSAKAVSGLLVVESNDVGELGGACCPEFIVTSLYRVTGGSLKTAGPDTRRDVFSSEHVNFARGRSGTTLEVTLDPGDAKRLIVNARKGQTLTASADSPLAEIGLVGHTQITIGKNSLSTKLASDGDHTIEVRNNAETRKTFTVTINIRWGPDRP